MATFCFNDCHVTINAVDLSDHVKSVTFDISANALDETAMADTTIHRIVGMKDWSVSVDFMQDFAAAKVDATLWAVYNGGAAVTIIVRPDSDAVGATNPNYTGSVVLTSYSPITGGVGDLATTSVTFEGAGALSRAVA